MSRPPRDPNATIANPKAIRQWIIFGATLFILTLIPLLYGPGELSPDQPNTRMTMAFVVMALGTIMSGLVMRRDPDSGLGEPILNAVKILAIPLLMTVCAVELNFMQRLLMTESLSGDQWLACLALALALPVVVELTKAVRRARAPHPSDEVDPKRAVNPARAR